MCGGLALVLSGVFWIGKRARTIHTLLYNVLCVLIRKVLTDYSKIKYINICNFLKEQLLFLRLKITLAWTIRTFMANENNMQPKKNSIYIAIFCQSGVLEK